MQKQKYTNFHKRKSPGRIKWRKKNAQEQAKKLDEKPSEKIRKIKGEKKRKKSRGKLNQL